MNIYGFVTLRFSLLSELDMAQNKVRFCQNFQNLGTTNNNMNYMNSSNSVKFISRCESSQGYVLVLFGCQNSVNCSNSGNYFD